MYSQDDLIGRVRLLPMDGTLVAHVGLSVVAFGDPRQRVESWRDPELYCRVS